MGVNIDFIGTYKVSTRSQNQGEQAGTAVEHHVDSSANHHPTEGNRSVGKFTGRDINRLPYIYPYA